MSDDAQRSLLNEVEEKLKEGFNKREADKRRVPSTALDAAPAARMDQLVLPDKERRKMPFTKDKFVIRENPHLVAWEREVRKFERNLSPLHGHRVSAVMIYEWATGISVADLANSGVKGTPGHPTWRADLRKINQILAYYFGKPYQTWICGKKVGKAYKIPAGYYIKRHRPLTLTLYVEYMEGVLNP